MKIQTAKIIVSIGDTYQREKSFCGTEDEIYAEAFDWMNIVALNFIHQLNIIDPVEQDKIIKKTGHTIIWDIDSPATGYAVVGELDSEVIGVFPTRADAEEAILVEAEDYAEYTLRFEDPKEVIGMPEWDWSADYKWIMFDTGRSFRIVEVPIFL